MSWLRGLRNWFLCNVVGDHDWTCNAEQGIDPTQNEIDQGVMGFHHYAQMYCNRPKCRKIYKP